MNKRTAYYNIQVSMQLSEDRDMAFWLKDLLEALEEYDIHSVSTDETVTFDILGDAVSDD